MVYTSVRLDSTKMLSLLTAKQDELRELCSHFRVKRLDLFGSVLGAAFDPERSDLDFLVEFLPLQDGEHFDSYFGLLEALEALFQRPVDLVMTSAIRNPYFMESVSQNRIALYAD